MTERFVERPLNLPGYDKHHLEEVNKGIVNNYYEILIGKTPVVRNAVKYFFKKFFLVVLTAEKRSNFKFQWNFTLKVNFVLLISLSLDDLYCPPKNQMEHIFQDLPFYCTKKVKKNHNQFCHFLCNLFPGICSDLDIGNAISLSVVTSVKYPKETFFFFLPYIMKMLQYYMHFLTKTFIKCYAFSKFFLVYSFLPISGHSLK